MASSIGQFFLGAPSRVEQVQKYNPQQLQALQQILGQSTEGLKNPYQGFEPIAQYARSQFNQQTVPSLAERFTSLGSNSTSSPAFASQLGQAGAGLEEALAAQKSQYGQQNISQLMQLLGMGLTQQHENVPVEGESGFLQSILPLLIQAGIGGITGGATGGLSAILPGIATLLGTNQGGR